MTIACLIATWRDGELLAGAVASAAPHVDVVVVLDGGYVGVVDEREWSSGGELLDAVDAGAICIHSSQLWPDEITKRNALLELGRAFLPMGDADRWALVLDADELLVYGEQLRESIRQTANVRPGLPRVEPDGRAWWAPSRLFELTPYVRYFERSYDLLDINEDGVGWRVWSLEHTELADSEWNQAGPYVRHRWDERPPWRQEVQQRYGRILAARDHGSA